MQDWLLLRAKVLERAALRATVTAETTVIETPVGRVRSRVLQGRQDFAREAIVADGGHGPFDAAFIARMAHPSRINVKWRAWAYSRNAGRDERIGVRDDRLRVIGKSGP